ncbi:glycoside hydrolase family 32 protein [Panacibacter sp. DH6]|uniref:Glycoside hydrolase family 32 protein n=1 Tax=Panacibacter microcysteis TaxID=2793269 RepID=A0A931E737_9BACT|nr:glycoside hydrolase family 32 protein [Panacibacter microcysteis]MBG9374956.1 glycoside hydrolase family 32 protein [Panacibacter microcysteis]
MKRISFIAGAAYLIINACQSTTEKNDTIINDTLSYRPSYHFTTDSNWINDPNGLVFANGKYHLFAQYNPFGDKWGHMSWAHATSDDLFNWQQQPLAIPEIKNADGTTTMIFSGSAVVDSFNTSGFGKDGIAPLVAVYTSHIDSAGKGLRQHQSIAYSTDQGKTWQQYENNPVLDIHLSDFRDPKVFWYAPEKKWVMAAVKPLEYKVQFYTSKNLKQWTLLSEFGNIGNTDKIWECPDLFPLTIEGTNDKKWILSLSGGHPQKSFLAVQYFIGNFDGKTFTADKLSYPLYIDYGKDFYAGITFNNIPSNDGRSIMIGWANCWSYANDIPTRGFRGAYTVPRVLTLKNTTDGLRLFQQPVSEITTYEKEIFSEPGITLENTARNLAHVQGTSLDVSFDLETSGTAGISVLKSGNEETVISFDAANNTLSLDRTRSGDTSFSNQFAGIEKINIPAGKNKISLRILVDKSIVEVFADGGLFAITDIVFPLKNEGGIAFFANNSKATFSNVQVKEIKKTIH